MKAYIILLPYEYFRNLSGVPMHKMVYVLRMFCLFDDVETSLCFRSNETENVTERNERKQSQLPQKIVCHGKLKDCLTHTHTRVFTSTHGSPIKPIQKGGYYFWIWAELQFQRKMISMIGGIEQRFESFIRCSPELLVKLIKSSNAVYDQPECGQRFAVVENVDGENNARPKIESKCHTWRDSSCGNRSENDDERFAKFDNATFNHVSRRNRLLLKTALLSKRKPCWQCILIDGSFFLATTLDDSHFNHF